MSLPALVPAAGPQGLGHWSSRVLSKSHTQQEGGPGRLLTSLSSCRTDYRGRGQSGGGHVHSSCGPSLSSDYPPPKSTSIAVSSRAQGEATQHLCPWAYRARLQSPVPKCHGAHPPHRPQAQEVMHTAPATVTPSETWAALTCVPRFPQWLNRDDHISPAYLMELSPGSMEKHFVPPGKVLQKPQPSVTEPRSCQHVGGVVRPVGPGQSKGSQPIG